MLLGDHGDGCRHRRTDRSPRDVGARSPRPSVVVPYLAFGAGNVVIGLATSAWVVAATGFVLGASITVWNVVTVTVRQRVDPGRPLRPRQRRLPLARRGGERGRCRRRRLRRQPVVGAHAVRRRRRRHRDRRAAVRSPRARRTAVSDDRSAGDRAAAAAHAGAAVDHVGLAGDPRRLVGGEEHGQVGDVLRFAEPLGRQVALELTRRSCRRAPWRSRSCTKPGAMPTTRVSAELVGELPREVDQRRLA